MIYAPIIVFAYNRPEHLKQTLQALALNKESKESDLYIFIDGPKNKAGEKLNSEVIFIAEQYTRGFFRNTYIKNKNKNLGLACSVIQGVSEIIEEFGRVIVVEDDAVAAPIYLKFMNEALEFYETDEKIWSIGGYTVPMSIPENYKSDIILTQRSSSCAWATWKNRWDKIDWDVKDYNQFHWDFRERARFNAWGDDRASMLDDQILGRVNSWAIRFDYAMFKNSQFNILPRQSLITNIGHDGSGTHNIERCELKDPFWVDLKKAFTSFNLQEVNVNEKIRKEFCSFFKSSKIDSAKRFVGNLFKQMHGRKLK